MTNWLQHYDYRISISIWLFAVVGVLVLLLTLIIVSLNTVKAAVSNPVKSLRTEWQPLSLNGEFINSVFIFIVPFGQW